MGEIRPLSEAAAPLEVIPYQLDLHYKHAFGPYYGRLFDEIRDQPPDYGRPNSGR